MARMNMIEAIRSAHDVVMDKDPSVVVLGEDVGYFGGVFRCTDGLQRKFGEHRVIDAPISEGGIIGAAIGMGVNGLRPVAEIQFADYIYPGFDQIVPLAGVNYFSYGFRDRDIQMTAFLAGAFNTSSVSWKSCTPSRSTCICISKESTARRQPARRCFKCAACSPNSSAP